VTLKGKTREPNTLRDMEMEIKTPFQRTTNRKYDIWGIKWSRDRWRHVSRDPKGAGGSTVGYPSDSMASCLRFNSVRHFAKVKLTLVQCTRLVK